MIRKIVLQALLILLLVVVQMSFINNFNAPLKYFSLVLSTLIFIAVIFSYYTALAWGLIVGFLMDMFSILPFGIHMATIFLTILVVNLLVNRIFTNKSIYTVAILGLIGTLFCNLLLILFNLLTFYFKVTDLEVFFTKYIFISTCWQVILNLIFLTILFITLWLTSKKLKSQFLSPKLK